MTGSAPDGGARPAPDRGAARDTRERILDAALVVLARDGYAAATMRSISREAGVALGLANYHFNSRRELLAEVIAISRERFLGVLDARLPEAPGPQTLRFVLESTRALAALLPNWYRLCADLDVQGLRDEELSRASAENKRRGQADVRLYLGAICAAFGVPVPPDIEGIASVLLAAFDGVAVRALTDPAFDSVAAYLALERMILAVIDPEARPLNRDWNRDPFPDVVLDERRPAVLGTALRPRSRRHLRLQTAHRTPPDRAAAPRPSP